VQFVRSGLFDLGIFKTVINCSLHGIELGSPSPETLLAAVLCNQRLRGVSSARSLRNKDLDVKYLLFIDLGRDVEGEARRRGFKRVPLT